MKVFCCAESCCKGLLLFEASLASSQVLGALMDNLLLSWHFFNHVLESFNSSFGSLFLCDLL